MRVVIAGAGIGGLAAAVALQRVGIETVMIEQAAEIGEVGAGLSLWSNAMNALRELGVEDKVLAAGSVVERILSQSLTGRHIGVTDLSGNQPLGGSDQRLRSSRGSAADFAGATANGSDTKYRFRGVDCCTGRRGAGRGRRRCGSRWYLLCDSRSAPRRSGASVRWLYMLARNALS